MICDVCGKDGAFIRQISRSYGKGNSLFIIEGIPLVSCPNCGESYLSAETLQELERIKLHRKAISKQRQVSVAKFA